MEMLVRERARWWGGDVVCRLTARADEEEPTIESGIRLEKGRGEVVRGGEQLW
jgi:hypothetical protein